MKRRGMCVKLMTGVLLIAGMAMVSGCETRESENASIGDSYVENEEPIRTLNGFVQIVNITEEGTLFSEDEEIDIQINVGYSGSGYDDVMYLQAQYYEDIGVQDSDSGDLVLHHQTGYDGETNCINTIPIDISGEHYRIYDNYNEYLTDTVREPFPEDGSDIVHVNIDKAALLKKGQVGIIEFYLTDSEGGRYTEFSSGIEVTQKEDGIFVKKAWNDDFLKAPVNVKVSDADSEQLDTGWDTKEISWEPVENASEYTIWRAEKENGEYVYHASTEEESYIDAGFGCTYYYRVKAGTGIGSSAFSEPVKVTFSK